MKKELNDIMDDEVRFIVGNKENSLPLLRQKKNRIKISWLFIVIILILVGVITLFYVKKHIDVEVIDERSYLFKIEQSADTLSNKGIDLLGDYSDTTDASYTEHLVRTINDIPLDIYIPHNGKAELMVGVPNIYDTTIIFTTQAADVRADNGKIVGAFVINGKPLSWGLSKQGFCAIIGDTITVGVTQNSPLFEQATERNGHFFRQYPLVKDGAMFMDNSPKGKAVRKALCDRNGEIMVVMSRTQESFHDFSEALVDLGVNQAIYLVGANSYGYFRDKFDHFVQIYEKHRGGRRYENFIVWRR